jgi:hypothetical protein
MFAVICVIAAYVLLLGGGVTMCCLYAPGERIDARGYWILAIMLVPQLLIVLRLLIWREPEEPEDDDADEA